MLGDYVDGYPGLGVTTAQYASNAVLVLYVGGLAYAAYKILGKERRAPKSTKRAALRKTSNRQSSRRAGSRAQRRAKMATKRLYFDRRDQTMKQRAADWVAEQNRKNRKRKSLRHVTV